ncbi:MAG: FAD-binding protein [Sphingomonadales bacterium]|jgi:glycolate oxidase FAD binding subunit
MQRPSDSSDLVAIISAAAAAGNALAVVGSGSRPGMGPGSAAGMLDVTGLGGGIDHDPAELLLTAPAATPMAAISDLLAAHGQCLAFEPPCPQPLWDKGEGTLGGAISTGLSGPRRPFAGAARDHVLAVAGVTGQGEPFRAGGKVLKNVTGFDLPRLLTGARGTLAVLTEITLKVLPLPPASATLAVPAATPAAAVAVLAAACAVDGGITGAAWGDGQCWLRIETSTAALPALLAAAHTRLPGATLLAEGAESREHWAGITSLAGWVQADDIVWRCVLPATRAGDLALPAGARLRLDWAGALAWVLLPAGDADFDMHAAAAAAGGHAERLRLPAGLHSRIPARPPLPAGVAALSQRIRAQFDPAGVLSPAAVPWGGA